jgi:hypothetical protein
MKNYKKSLDILMQIVPENNTDVAITYNNIALLVKSNGNL